MLADREIAFVNHVVDYIDAILERVIDKCGLAVLDLVKGRFLGGIRVNVGKPVIVINGH
jgi:hypothetical protein